MQVNDAGLELIKRHEKCKLKAYKDPAGVLTIGFGHTGEDVEEGLVICQEEADELLQDDLITAEDAVEELVDAEINENQHAALVSFVFNCGTGSLKSSHLLTYLNQGDYAKAADEFPRWNHSGGRVLAELTRRRAEERELFLREPD